MGLKIDGDETVIELYTDGSVYPNPGYGGYAAVVVTKNGRGAKLSNFYPHKTTNNEMECYAIVAAMKYIWKTNPNPEKIVLQIYSDSKFAINILVGEWINKANPNIDVLLDDFNTLCEKFGTVNLEWVRGHSGDEYNELANVLAEYGRWQNPNLPERYRKNPYQKG